ncbi:MAG: GtrA family protein [Firmicutes bacterium]|nr:GtrA family protein [Bacillota bacterium]MCM1400553.1 GtrA family protein [Bacteroides sp.]MCM1476457.1 GtrA family protein [Bacteroides sp.]
MDSNKLRNVGSNLIKSDKLIYSFLRSAVSSQTASWVDLITCFVLFEWAGLMPWLSTAIGALLGGIINCVINYRFTFHAQDVPWKAVAVKYAMVWFGSLLLNSLGTEGLYHLLNSWHFLETIGFEPAGYFAAARLIVSLLVSWFWNFVMQRYFVYRTTRFDNTAIKFVDFFTAKHS